MCKWRGQGKIYFAVFNNVFDTLDPVKTIYDLKVTQQFSSCLFHLPYVLDIRVLLWDELEGTDQAFLKILICMVEPYIFQRI
jgi:hypothetical protein